MGTDVNGEANNKKDALWSDRLWGRSPNPSCRCGYLVVVGPYPTRAFFKEFIKRFNPKKVIVVVDEGWRDKEIDLVRKALSKVEHKVRFAGASGGLVHAKLYYVEWEVKAGGNVRRQLLWGSANASLSGFGVNAEALSSVALQAASHDTSVIEDYFRLCEGGVEGTRLPETLVRPAPGVRLALPSFELKKDLKDISFDAWLQKGLLCHAYQPDPGFGSFTIKLKKPLPSSDLVRYVSRQGATTDAKHDVWRLPFHTKKQGKAAKGKKPKRDRLVWKRRYFVETWLGFWTSAECAAAAADGTLLDDKGRVVKFVAPGEQGRRALVEALASLDERARGPKAMEYLRAYKSRLQAIFNGICKKTDASKYFVTLEGGDLDTELYLERARKQLVGQRNKAKPQWLRERFANGFEFLHVPPLRGVGAGEEADSFEELAGSFVQSLSILANKRRKENRLMLAIAHALGPGKPPGKAISEDDKTLLRRLRKDWGKHRKQIREFYRE